MTTPTRFASVRQTGIILNTLIYEQNNFGDIKTCKAQVTNLENRVTGKWPRRNLVPPICVVLLQVLDPKVFSWLSSHPPMHVYVTNGIKGKTACKKNPKISERREYIFP